MPRKLPVLQTLREVFVTTTGSYRSFLSAASGPVAIAGMGIGLYVWSGYRAGVDDIGTMLRFGVPGEWGENPYAIFIPKMSSPEFWVGIALIAVASVILAVRLHRFVLLDDGADDPRDAVYGRYVWTATKIGVISFLVSIALAIGLTKWLLIPLVDFAMQYPGALAFVGLAGFVFRLVTKVIESAVSMRISMALPNAALGGPAPVFRAFMAAHGNTWRLVLCDLVVRVCETATMFALAVACAVVSGFAPAEFGNLEGVAGFAALFVLGLPLFLYLLMLRLTLLSVAYREIVGLPGGHEGEATVAEPSPGL